MKTSIFMVNKQRSLALLKRSHRSEWISLIIPVWWCSQLESTTSIFKSLQRFQESEQGHRATEHLFHIMQTWINLGLRVYIWNKLCYKEEKKGKIKKLPQYHCDCNDHLPLLGCEQRYGQPHEQQHRGKAHWKKKILERESSHHDRPVIISKPRLTQRG